MIWLWLIFIVVLIFGLVVFRGAPYVPSRKFYVDQALHELYPLSASEVLVDIGSGDGIVLREAAKSGARAIGYEINPILVFISYCLSRKYKRINIKLADFWLSHLPNDTTVVYVFSVTRDMNKIIKWMQRETNRLDRPIHLINYGSELKGVRMINKVGAYRLYIFHPLQLTKAQV
jgi:DNA-binding Lrp family transcriptional regulator